MKMFKRLAAVVLAAVMSMAVLTACGGGSSSSGSKMKNLLSGNKFYIEYTDLDDGTKTIEAVSAKGVYIKTMEEDGTTFQYWYKDGMCYDYMQSAGQTMAYKYKADDVGMGVSSTGSLLQNVKVNPSYEIKKLGKTYYAETLEEDGVRLAYCFEGNKLVYMVEVDLDDNTETVYKVNECKSTFDDSLLELPAGVEFKDLK